MADKKTILVVDDEPRVSQLVSMNLSLEGFRVVTAPDGYEALNRIVKDQPDLVLLDITMPDMDGFQTLKKIRESSTIPVIFLTVRGEEFDRVHGLDLGADDYVTKPFSPRELISRINAVLRRTETSAVSQSSEVVVDEDLTINFDQRRVTVRGEEIRLRPTEHRLLYQLVNNAGRLMSHETLLAKVWGPEYRDEDNYVRLYITYLRQEIEKDPKNPKYIIGERGLGYRFREIG